MLVAITYQRRLHLREPSVCHQFRYGQQNNTERCCSLPARHGLRSPRAMYLPKSAEVQTGFRTYNLDWSIPHSTGRGCSEIERKVETQHTPVRHQILRSHARGHSLILLNCFLLVLVGVVLFDESGSLHSVTRSSRQRFTWNIHTWYPDMNS